MRMVAASSVLISHAYPISRGIGAEEPLEHTLHISLGTLSVITFFVVSGFFISQSFDRKKQIAPFIVARVLRLYPGLLLSLIITLVFLGPFLTTETIGSYFSDWSMLTYLFRNLSLKWLQYDLPGVFQNNPYPFVVNGSLWSLFYEVVCYGLVLGVGLSGVSARHVYFFIFLCVYFLLYFALKLFDLQNHIFIYNMQQLTLPFVIGMSFFQFRRFVPLSAALCVLGAVGAVLAYHTSWFDVAFIFFWSYLIFYIGYLPSRVLGIYNRAGDYSYGMYIYAFPCEQIGVALWHGISPLGLMAVSFPATLCCAFLSWHLLESRALAYRGAVGGRLERVFAGLRA